LGDAHAGGYRLGHLETMRGLAALVVFTHHIIFAFNPLYEDQWSGSPLFVLFNGKAAVVFFFILSGYVLTIGALRTASLRPILHGAIKRWPRLAGPVLLAVLLSWSFWQLGLFRHVEAAQVTGSEWLENFAHGSPPPYDLLTFGSALREGSWGVFLTGKSFYDSVLWTMRIELFGSFMVFGLAAALILLRRRPSLQILLLAAAAPVVHSFSPFFLAFWLGIALAWLDSILEFRTPVALGVTLTAVGLYGLGYDSSIEAYLWIPPGSNVYVHSAAAALLLFAATSCKPIRTCLDVPLGRLLGRYSFSLYLLHLLILMSLGMLTFLLVLELVGLRIAVVISILATIFGTVAASHLLVRFELWWITVVNRAAGTLIQSAITRFAPTRGSREVPCSGIEDQRSVGGEQSLMLEAEVAHKTELEWASTRDASKC
jgi:peptidoglycan/LPS O-acetylase OafA/YrhL